MFGTLKFSIVSLGYLRSANIILPASLGDKNVSVAIFVQVDKDVGVVAHLKAGPIKNVTAVIISVS